MRARRKNPSEPRSLWVLSAALAALLGAGLLLLGGCESDDCVGCVPPPPPAPTGVWSVTGDESVTVCWSHVQTSPRAPEVVEYLVWRDLTPWDDDEVFEFAGRVEVVDQNQLTYCFEDRFLDNGFDYSYAVSAVDRRGGESELSREFVHDTPRPEGSNSVLLQGDGLDFHNPNLGAYAVRSQPAAASADIAIVSEGVLYAQVHRPASVEIQDYGTFVDSFDNVRLDWVDWAPESGYSQAGRVELIRGHAYVLRIREPGSSEIHYAKFAVTTLDAGAGAVIIDWAYQIAPDWPQLSLPTAPGVRGQTVAGMEQETIRF
jgi:hypothetical protein